MKRLAACLAALCLAVAPAARAQGSGSPTLDAMRARGALVCGVSGTTPGFSLPDSGGEMRGSDADFCRSVAAAALGDASRVRFVALSSTNRFTALQSGEVDLLARTATWRLGREASLGLMFTGVTFYDGTAFMVKTASGLRSARDLDGATICILPGTSTELAVSDWFRQNGLRFTPLLIDSTTALRGAFLADRCDAYATDSSALAAFRANAGDRRDDFTLLPELISKEPLGPVVRKGDDRWFDIVRWTLFALLAAEEGGVTSANAREQLGSANPDIRRLLGADGALGPQLGLDPRWAFTVITQLGNFAEQWQRNLAPLGLSRGVNALWSQGGLHYSPPFR
ncbi:MAG TPA: amino acid ABC transporter substrate-binding protein [Roseomonas sp.]